MKIPDKKIRAYALKNAVAYGGRANQGAVISALFHEGMKKDEIKNYAKLVAEIVKEVNSISIEEQEKEFKKLEKDISHREEREGLPELPSVSKSGVIMRSAPSASGALHLFHGINIALSFNYVKKYGGKLYIRIEDTNPENIDEKAYGMIKKDAEWLTKGRAIVAVQSDSMQKYYDYAEKLIKKSSAYVCTCSSEKFKKFADFRENCPCRNNDSKENLLRWKKMLDKNGYKEGNAVLRFKSNMQDPNPAMRDFPLARINETNHPRQKNKYKVWPLMNLAVSVDDIEMKMTHIIRGKDHRDNAKRQEMIFKALGKKYPWVGFLGRYHFKDMEISTSKFRQGIEKGIYSGWDDPKLPTLISLRNRGYKPEAFWKIAEHIGLSEVDKIADSKEFFGLLGRFNK